MENSSFRQFFKEGSDRPAEDSPEARKAKAEEAQRKKAKAKVAQERRMAILKKREEQLAEDSRYRDRAGERRKELEKAIKAGEAAPEEVAEAGMGADSFVEESKEDKEAALPTGLTYAQADGREDLERQQHRVSIAQSKYLGGDIEHTHLVKGLDFALLQKNRAQLTVEEQEKEQAERERAEKAERRGGAAAGQDKPGAKRSSSRKEGSSLDKPAESELARGVQRALFMSSSRPNRALVSGRLLLEFDVGQHGADVPSSLVRSEDELLPEAERAGRTKKLLDAAMPAQLLARLQKVLAYAGKRTTVPPKKSKKLKAWGSAEGALQMRPLQRRAAPTPAPEMASGSSAPLPAAAAAAAAAVAQLGKSLLEGAKGGGAAAGKGAVTPAKAKAALPKRLGGSDFDDMFGEGVGSDYVCAPNEEQAKKARQDAADSEEVRRLTRHTRPEAAVEEEEDGGDAVEEEVAAPRKRANADVDGLLAHALAEGKRSRYDAEEGEVAEEGDEDEAALLKRKAGKDKDKESDKPKSKNLAMDHQSGDSYAECFPESFEGYTMELGPDSDDEANVVRSKKEDDEPEAEAEAEAEEGKGGNRKERRKKGPGKEKIEELKQEAKLSRELVQLEKYMEERKQKRDQRDDDGEGGAPARGSRGADMVSQNEMF